MSFIAGDKEEKQISLESGYFFSLGLNFHVVRLKFPFLVNHMQDLRAIFAGASLDQYGIILYLLRRITGNNMVHTYISSVVSSQ